MIRRHRVRDVDLDDLVRLGTLDTALAAFLRAAIGAGKNIVVTGLQNAGKTTLIRTLANEFAPMERFATIEKEYELHLHDLPDRHPRVVAMEAREGSAEKDGTGRRAGEVTLTELVHDALRMNLRRIIVGEVRGGEVLPMLEAMSTGDGSLVHPARPHRPALDRPHRDPVPVGRVGDDRHVRVPVAGRVGRLLRPGEAAGRDRHRGLETQVPTQSR